MHYDCSPHNVGPVKCVGIPAPPQLHLLATLLLELSKNYLVDMWSSTDERPDGWASTILQEAGSVEIPVTVILHVKIVKAIQVEGVASIAKLRTVFLMKVGKHVKLYFLISL